MRISSKNIVLSILIIMISILNCGTNIKKVEAEGVIAKIGNKEYTDVNEWLYDWMSYDDNYTEIYQDLTLPRWLVFRQNVEKTINLNGHTIKRVLSERESEGSVVAVGRGAKAHIINGTISGGYQSGNGGGITVGENAELTLEKVVVKDNTAEANYFYVGGHGGGIYMDTGSKLNLIESQIQNNVAEYNGGGIFMDGDGIQIIGDGKSSIHHNEAEGSGGAVYMEDENGLVDNLSFYQNIAPAYKGTIYINGENNKISNLHLSNNAYLTTYEVIVDNDYTTIENCNIEGQVYTTEDIDKGFYIKGKTNIELLTINKNCYVNFELTEGSEVFIKLLYEDDYTDGKARRLTEGAGSDKFGKNSDYYHQGQESHKYVFYHSWTHYIAYNGKPEYQKFNIVKEGYSNPDLYGIPYVPDKQVTLQYLDYNTGNIVAQTETRTVSQSETLKTVISEVPNYEFIGWDTRRDSTGYPTANELDPNPNKSYSFDVLRDGEVIKAWYKPVVNKITVNMSSPVVDQAMPSISKETICASLNKSVVRNAYLDPSNIEVTWNPSHAQAHGDTEYSVTLKLKYDNQDNGLNIYRNHEDEKQNVRGYFVYGVDNVDTSSMTNVKDVVLDKQNNSITITFHKTPDETPEETRVIRVYDIEDITADYGISDDELQRLLPKDVGVELSNNVFKLTLINWDWNKREVEEDPTNGAKMIKVKGTLQLDSGVIYDPGQNEVSINVFIKGKEQVAKPVANKPTGIYNNYFDLELTTTTEGATIYYAVDNNGILSGYQIYKKPLNLGDLVDDDTVIIYAYADKDDFLRSDLTILGYLFTKDQVATPLANNYSGTYNNFFDLELTTTTEGATIYYSYDYDSVIKYKGPINLENLVDNNEVFILVYAVKEGMTDSDVVDLNYRFEKLYYPDREIKTWTKGDSQGQSVIFKASIYDADTYENFNNLLEIAKGSDITPQTQWSSISSANYTIKPGSLITDFKKEYLETLDVGDYTVKANFKDGEATVILRIYPKTTPPTPEPEPTPKPVTPTYVVPKTGVE